MGLPEKIILARCLPAEATMNVKWLDAELHMGSWNYEVDPKNWTTS
jgi:hypothetical protein